MMVHMTETNMFPSLVDQARWNKPAAPAAEPEPEKPKRGRRKKTNDEEPEAEMRTDSRKLVAKRAWICMDGKGGCKGRSPWLGWGEKRPDCPKCGGRMYRHQWAERE